MTFWLGDLIPHMARFETAFSLGLDHYLEEKAQEVESYAKETAPWEDRTGGAREGLTAQATRQGARRIIYLYHTVDYGIWLEIRWGGRFAVIQPTLDHFGPEVMNGMSFSTMLGHVL